MGLEAEESIIIENKEEKIARREEIVRKAVRKRNFIRFIGGAAMDVWDYLNCPKWKRWLWHKHNECKTIIWNTNLEIGWLRYNSPFAKNLV